MTKIKQLFILFAAYCGVSFVCYGQLSVTTAAAEQDRVFVLGSPGTEVHTVIELSDRTVLLAGGTTKLDWLPTGITPTLLGGADTITGEPSGRTAFLLQLNSELTKILRCCTLPHDKAGDINYLRTSNEPGKPTGLIYLSGTRVGVDKDKAKKPGYYLARLDGNFVNQPPTKLQWVENITAEGECQQKQPWDVGPDGGIVYAQGGPHGYDWFSVNALTPDGKPAVMEHWRTHWYVNSEGKESEWAGSPASQCPHGKVIRSGIVLKVWGRGDFRSWTQADYDQWSADGNGGRKKGRWPYDAFFAGPFNPADPNNSPRGRGYTGYGWPGTPCGNMQAIHIDRRTGELYLGGNHKSALPKGPDFEPFVVAMTKTGDLRWWMRLYREVPPAEGKAVTDDQDARLSTPDQYIEALTVDYTQPANAGALVVVARAHGNNVINFWKGNEIKHPDNPGGAFQNFFTGSNGNIHYGWLGRMTTADGTMLHATYVGEYNEGAKVGKKSWEDPNLDGWPRFDSAWPDLNTTRLQSTVRVNARGEVFIVGVGRRPITTANAWKKNVKPSEGKGTWQHFTRGYTPDLTSLTYSTIFSGPWDTETGTGAADVELKSIATTDDGILVVGRLKADKAGTVIAIPTQGAPTWAAPANTPGAIIARLRVQK